MPSYQRHAKIPGKNATELYEIVNREIDRLFDKSPVQGAKLSRDEASKSVEVKHSYFSAKLICTDGSLKLDGQLSFIALPFRGQIDDVINRWITKTFPGSTHG